MILKYFLKHSDKYKEHLIEMQENVSAKDKEAIEMALHDIAKYTELNTLLSEQCKQLEKDYYELSCL